MRTAHYPLEVLQSSGNVEVMDIDIGSLHKCRHYQRLLKQVIFSSTIHSVHGLKLKNNVDDHKVFSWRSHVMEIHSSGKGSSNIKLNLWLGGEVLPWIWSVGFLQVTEDTNFSELAAKEAWLSSTQLVVKPDMLFGKRGKSGLVCALSLCWSCPVFW
jgi:hypothetical protein